MASGGIIGTHREKRDELLNVVWEIDNFLSLSDTIGNFYESPLFRFSTSTWYLRIYPYPKDREEWVGIYLMRNEITAGDIISFQCGIEDSDGKFYLKQYVTWSFRKNSGYGEKCFIERSDLMKRKRDYLPSGILTVVCRLKKPHLPLELSRMSEGLKEVLASKKLSDVTIHVGQQAFEAHKVILAAFSPVFAAKFDGDLAEKNSGTIIIEDCDPESFKDFLQFLYTDIANITPSNVSQLYKTAHVYRVEELKSQCAVFMMQNASVDNICDVVALADRYLDTNLNFFCRNFFQKNILSILRTPKWKSLMTENNRLANKLLNWKLQI